MSTRQRRGSFAYALAPGLVVLLVAVAVAAALGGPIAAALGGAAFTSALLVDVVLVLLLLRWLTGRPRWVLVLSGSVAYVVAVLVVLALWSAFGPSQIM